MKLPKSLASTALVALSAGAAWGQAVRINEAYVHHFGMDTQEFVELAGPGGLSLTNRVVIAVDGDAGEEGIVEFAIDLSGHVMPPDGFFVIGNDAVPEADVTIGPVNNLGNGTQTLYFMSSSNPQALVGLVGSNVDPDGDGSTILPQMGTILDHVGLVDDGFLGALLDDIYDKALPVGPPPSGTVSGIYRDGSGSQHWCGGAFLDFDPVANQAQPRTPGGPNGVCVPASLTYDGLTHTSLGTSGLFLDSLGLNVTTLGSNGQDGADIVVPTNVTEYTGCELDLDYAPASTWETAASARIEAQFDRIDIDPKVDLVVERGSLDKFAIRVETTQISYDCYVVEYYFGPILVKQKKLMAVDPPGPIDVADLLAESFRVEFLGGNDNFNLWVNFQQPLSLLDADGTMVIADRIRIELDGLAEDYGELESVQVLGDSIPPFTIRSERLAAFGNLHRVEGPAQYDPWLEDDLHFTGFDSTGLGGIAIDLRDGSIPQLSAGYADGAGFDVDVQASGDHELVLEARGTYANQVDVELGVLNYNNHILTSEIDVAADFTGLGTGLVEVQVYDDGALVGSMQQPAGPQGTLSALAGGLPDLIQVGIRSGSASEPPAYYLQFDGDVGFNATFGDGIRFAAVGAPEAIEIVSTVTLHATDVDELVILGERPLDGCDSQSYCVASPNSVGPGAVISSNGECGVVDDALVLQAQPVPNTPGIFFYGAGQTQLPFGDGVLCVAPPLCRLPIALGQNNVLTLAVDLAATSGPCQIQPGSTWNFQAWYRDQAAGGAGYNLSDALRLSFD